MKKRILSCLLALTMAGSLLAGCGKEGNGEEQQKTEQEAVNNQESVAESDQESEQTDQEVEPEPVTIVIGGWPEEDSVNYEVKENQRKEFMDKHPWITVETSTYIYGVDSFLPLAASGQLPTIYGTYFTDVEKIINAGYAADITDGLNKYGMLEPMDEGIKDIVSDDNGRVYALPWNAYAMGLVCNVALFKEAGLVDAEGYPILPTTWDEVLQSAIAIKEKTGKVGFAMPTTDHGGWLFTNLVWCFGGDFEEQVDGKWKAIFDSEEAVAALSYMKDMKWKYDVIQPDVSQNIVGSWSLLGSDQAGMCMSALSHSTDIITSTEMTKDGLAMTTIPAGPGGKYAQMGGGVLMVSANSTEEQIDAALLWLSESEYAPFVDEDTIKRSEEYYQVNVEKGLVVGPKSLTIWDAGELYEKDAELRAKYCNVDMKLWEAYSDHVSEGLKPEPAVNAQELYSSLNNVLQEIFTNENADCQAVLSEAAANFQSDYLDSAK